VPTAATVANTASVFFMETSSLIASGNKRVSGSHGCGVPAGLSS
jgi:hypothetical protein